MELIDEGKICKYFGKWRNFDSELSYKPVPFYTTNKELMFFGHGWDNVPRVGLCGNVICYQAGMIVMDNRTIEQKCSQGAVRCVLCLCGYENKQMFGTLLEYPYLLQAILKKQSEEKRIVLTNQKDDSYYLYHLKYVVVPDNYKEFVQHRVEQISYKTFEEFPDNLKNAIMQHYETQNNIRPN